MFLKNSDGSYFPSYFVIKIDSDEDISNILSKHESTFYHEYLHLLQDLICPYCIRENLVKLEEFFLIINTAVQDKSITLPVKTRDDDIEVTDLQSQYTWGEPNFIKKVTKIVDLDRKKSKSFEGQTGTFNVYKYTIITDLNKKYHIGAWHFLEYIAYKIENRYWPYDAPDLPYNSIDLLFNYMGLSHVSEHVRVCVAEYCLLRDDPMNGFVFLIDYIKKENVDALNDYESCQDLLMNLRHISKGQVPETIEEKIERRTQVLKKYLGNKFPVENFPKLYSWIDSVIDYTKSNLAGKLFFSELYELDEAQFKEKISELYNYIGVPLVLNVNNNMGLRQVKSGGSEQFIQLLLAYKFPEYVKSDYFTCPLCDICEENNPDIMNDDCISAPFKRVSKTELCPFAVFIKTHGLSKVTWHKG